MIKAEIQKAIGDHGIWKNRLASMIEQGKTDVSAATARADDQCPFGKWLKGLTGPDSASSQYQDVKKAHADFHRVAARVVDFAGAGKKVEATKLMEPKGDFTNASAILSTALLRWGRSLPE